MFYTIDHLNDNEQGAFEAAYAQVIAAEEAGLVSAENLDNADNTLALAAACDAGYAMPLIEEVWEWLT